MDTNKGDFYTAYHDHSPENSGFYEHIKWFLKLSKNLNQLLKSRKFEILFKKYWNVGNFYF